MILCIIVITPSSTMDPGTMEKMCTFCIQSHKDQFLKGAHLLHSSAHLPLPYSGDGHWSKRPQVRFHELIVFPTPMKRKTYNLQTIHSLMCAPQYVVSAVAGSISQSNLPTALEFDLVFVKIGLLILPRKTKSC